MEIFVFVKFYSALELITSRIDGDSDHRSAVAFDGQVFDLLV